MRIVAGKYRSRKISFPNVPEKVRPTMDKVREAVFSSLSIDIVNAEILDLFAGSGAYGIEALSRGARHGTFVDNYKLSIKCINENISLLKEENATVIESDYKDALLKLKDDKKVFDVIFLDPPYRMDVYLEIIKFLINNNMVSSYHTFVLECDHDLDLQDLTCYRIKKYNYSDTIVYILRGYEK